MDQPTRLELELWALGELEADRIVELDALFEADADLAAHAESVRASVEEAAFELPELPALDDLPATGDQPAAGDLPQPANRPVSAWRGVAALFAFAAAALLAVVVWPGAPSNEVRFRGALDVEVHRVRMGAAELTGSIVLVQTGDRLQYSVTSDQSGYIAVFDLQDDGVLSEWMPARQAKALQTIEGAVVLDAYPGSERVFFVFAEDPVRRDDVEAALTRSWDVPLAELDALELPSGVDQRSILLVRDAQ